MNYESKVRHICGSGLVRFFPCNERSGSTLVDFSEKANDGAYGGSPNFANNPTIDGKRSPLFDGSTDYGLEATISTGDMPCDGNGTMGGWFNFDSGIWSSGNNNTILQLRANADNWFRVRSQIATDKIEVQARAAATSFSAAITSFSDSSANTFVCMAVTDNSGFDYCIKESNGTVHSGNVSITSAWDTSTWTDGWGIMTTANGAPSNLTGGKPSNCFLSTKILTIAEMELLAK